MTDTRVNLENVRPGKGCLRFDLTTKSGLKKTVTTHRTYRFIAVWVYPYTQSIYHHIEATGNYDVAERKARLGGADYILAYTRFPDDTRGYRIYTGPEFVKRW